MTGSAAAPPGGLAPQIPLRAGPLTCVFEAGDLRYIRLGGEEIVRRIYGAVRDGAWGTVPPSLSRLAVDSRAASFVVSYVAEHVDGAVDFCWEAQIDGRADGTIRFAFSGAARAAFDRNRIGLCVLHPIRECAGRPAVTRDSSGARRTVQFPPLVAREQPVDGFHDLAGIEYLTGAGASVHLEFGGEIFETEDQRNWIDGSFKTYGTPLSRPRPVRIEAGTRVEQYVRLRVVTRPGRARFLPPEGGSQAVRADGWLPASAGSVPEPIAVRVTGGPRPLAAFGIGLTPRDSASAPASRRLELLRLLRPAHVRIDVGFDPGWQDRLRDDFDIARALGCGVELALDLPAGSDAADQLIGRLDPSVPIARVLVLGHGSPTTPAECLALVRAAFGGRAAGAPPVGTGSRADLYELHLFPPPPGDLLFWSMNPQVHATDLTSIAETPPAAADQVRSVRIRHPGCATAISPVAFRRRGGPSGPDPRQASLSVAAWTLGVAKYVAEAGAGSVTFFEGPADLGAGDGAVFPLFHVLADIAGCAGGRVVSTSSGMEGVETLLVECHGGRVLLAANLTRATVHLVPPPGFRTTACRRLDTESAPRAGSDPAGFRAEMPVGPSIPLILEPFATCRIDGRLEG